MKYLVISKDVATQKYDLIIEHRANKADGWADSFSQRPCNADCKHYTKLKQHFEIESQNLRRIILSTKRTNGRREYWAYIQIKNKTYKTRHKRNVSSVAKF